MTAPVTPYTRFLGDREPLAALSETIGRVAAVVRDWTPDRFEQSYAPGKWSARQLLTHLAQTELAIGSRARMALSTTEYVAQPWDQDSWIGLDAMLEGRDAVAAFLATARMNLAFFRALSPAQRALTFDHPEYGMLTVDWIVHQMAGHQINHLLQLEQI